MFLVIWFEKTDLLLEYPLKVADQPKIVYDFANYMLTQKWTPELGPECRRF